MSNSLRVIKDYFEEISVQIPLILDPVKNDPTLLNEAIGKLLLLEKKTRLGNDAKSSKLLAVSILQLCIDNSDWKALGEHIALLCKRHAQLKQVVTEVIQTAMKFLDETPNVEIKTDLIKTMCEVSKGKMYVELEYARMSRILAKIKEDAGNIKEASEIMQNIQIETLGSMEFDEKAEYLLEQFRLTMETDDFVRAELVSKKVSPEKLNSDIKFEKMKLNYYDLLIRYHIHSSTYLEVCRAYMEIFRSKSIQDDTDKWKQPLRKAVIYISIAPFDSEVSDLRHRILTEKQLKDNDLKSCQKMLKLLTTDKLIAWPLGFNDEWCNDPIFVGSKGSDIDRWESLKTSVVQHNIRVFANYYRRVRLERMSDLLKLETKETEHYISEMVQSKQIFALIDRPNGIVRFQKTQNADDVLNLWATDISDLLTNVDKTCHLIAKENMVYGIA